MPDRLPPTQIASPAALALTTDQLRDALKREPKKAAVLGALAAGLVLVAARQFGGIGGSPESAQAGPGALAVVTDIASSSAPSSLPLSRATAVLGRWRDAAPATLARNVFASDLLAPPRADEPEPDDHDHEVEQEAQADAGRGAFWLDLQRAMDARAGRESRRLELVRATVADAAELTLSSVVTGEAGGRPGAHRRPAAVRGRGRARPRRRFRRRAHRRGPGRAAARRRARRAAPGPARRPSLQRRVIARHTRTHSTPTDPRHVADDPTPRPPASPPRSARPSPRRSRPRRSPRRRWRFRTRPGPATCPTTRSPSPPSGRPRPVTTIPSPSPRPAPAVVPVEQDDAPPPDVRYDRLSETVDIRVSDADLSDVLRMLSSQSRRNIVAGPEVTGKVTCSLFGVTVEQALEAILRGNGFVAREEGDFIYVYGQQQLADLQAAQRRQETRVFRLYHVTAESAATLVAPSLSESATVSFSAPAEAGVGSSREGRRRPGPQRHRPAHHPRFPREPRRDRRRAPGDRPATRAGAHRGHDPQHEADRNQLLRRGLQRRRRRGLQQLHQPGPADHRRRHRRRGRQSLQRRHRQQLQRPGQRRPEARPRHQQRQRLRRRPGGHHRHDRARQPQGARAQQAARRGAGGAARTAT